ncbi:hypothetical protein T484DRAFT_1798812 [Baffinella frigidus]|nr:hypothetical protein T484DRAFT_1798812 [Cryptophyta sp. CCMP2293]
MATVAIFRDEPSPRSTSATDCDAAAATCGGERPGRSQVAATRLAAGQGQAEAQDGSGPVGHSSRRGNSEESRVWGGWVDWFLQPDTAPREAQRGGRLGFPRQRHASAAGLWLAIIVTCFVASAGQFYPPPNENACPGDRALEGLLPPDGFAEDARVNANLFRPACSRAVPNRSNGPATGSVSMRIEGSMMGYSDRSVAVRVGYTACENSMWISMTSVACLMAAGGGQTRSMDAAIAVTVFNGQVSRPVTGYFTYEASSLSTLKRSNQR